MNPTRHRSAQPSAAKLVAIVILIGSCGGGGAVSGTGGAGGAQGSGGVAGGASAGAGGLAGSAGTAGASGSLDAAGSSVDASGSDAIGGGFAADFTARARAALAAGAPSWTCATALPNIPVADAAAAQDAVRQFIAQVVGVPSSDIMMTAHTCGITTPTTCATTFAHDTAKSGGAIYDSVAPLAQELEANATDIAATIWVPMQDGSTLAADVVMTGISDGLLVGMVVFNAPYACQ